MSKIKKVVCLLLCVSMLAVIFTACGSKSAEQPAPADTAKEDKTVEESKAPERKMVIALTMPDLTNLWWISIEQGVRAECEKIGAQFMPHDAKGDVSKQVSAIENFIAQKVDGIIIGAAEPNAIEDAAKAAKDAGIAVITVSTPLNNDQTNITVSEREMGLGCGEMAAEWIKKVHGDKPVEVAILDYPTLPSVIERADSIAEVLNKEVPNAKVVARQSAATVAEGLQAGETILQAHPDVKVVCAINDGGALGFAKALAAAGKAGDDVGCFGISTADEFMLEMANPDTVLRGTLDLYPLNLGSMAVQSVIKIKNGEEVPKVQNTPLVKVWQSDAEKWLKDNGKK